jgi:hypothetical protein
MTWDRLPTFSDYQFLIKCPFCGEDEFDLIGLKIHLLNHCEEFKELEPT